MGTFGSSPIFASVDDAASPLSSETDWLTDIEESPCVDFDSRRIYCVICGGSSSEACLDDDGGNIDDVAWMSEWRALIKTHPTLDFIATSSGRLLQNKRHSDAYKTIAISYRRYVVNTRYDLRSPKDDPLVRPVHSVCYETVAACINGLSAALRVANHKTLEQIYDFGSEDLGDDDIGTFDGRLDCCNMRWSDEWKSSEDTGMRHYAGDPHYMLLSDALALVDDSEYRAKDPQDMPSRQGMQVSEADLTLRLPPEIIERIAEAIMADSWAHDNIRYKDRTPAGDAAGASTEPEGLNGRDGAARATSSRQGRSASAHGAAASMEPTAGRDDPSMSVQGSGRQAGGGGLRSGRRGRRYEEPQQRQPQAGVQQSRAAAAAAAAAAAGAGAGAGNNDNGARRENRSLGAVTEADRTLLNLMATCKRFYHFSYPSNVWKLLCISRYSRLSIAWPSLPERWFYDSAYPFDELEYIVRSCNHSLALVPKLKSTPTDPLASTHGSASTAPPPSMVGSHIDDGTCQCKDCQEELAIAIDKEEALARSPPEKVYRGLSKLHGLQNRQRICHAVYRRDMDLMNRLWSPFETDGFGALHPAFIGEMMLAGGFGLAPAAPGGAAAMARTNTATPATAAAGNEPGRPIRSQPQRRRQAQQATAAAPAQPRGDQAPPAAEMLLATGEAEQMGPQGMGTEIQCPVS